MSFFLQANERIQDLENGSSSKLGNRCIKLFIFISFLSLKAELQKALSFAEEQMENVKVGLFILMIKII
jgi:hypothetical protein